MARPMWGEGLPADAWRVAVAAFTAVRLGRAPEVAELTAWTGLSSGTVADALACLFEAGQVNLDGVGSVVAVAGLSVVPARHQLVLDGRSLFTWCAWDAIGIPAALAADAEIRTVCPHCRGTIEVLISGGRLATDAPGVLWLPVRCAGNPQVVWCPQASLFCCGGHLTAWMAVHGEPSGEAIGLAEAGRRGAAHWACFRTE